MQLLLCMVRVSLFKKSLVNHRASRTETVMSVENDK